MVHRKKSFQESYEIQTHTNKNGVPDLAATDKSPVKNFILHFGTEFD